MLLWNLYFQTGYNCANRAVYVLHIFKMFLLNVGEVLMLLQSKIICMFFVTQCITDNENEVCL